MSPRGSKRYLAQAPHSMSQTAILSRTRLLIAPVCSDFNDTPSRPTGLSPKLCSHFKVPLLEDWAAGPPPGCHHPDPALPPPGHPVTHPALRIPPPDLFLETKQTQPNATPQTWRDLGFQDKQNPTIKGIPGITRKPRTRTGQQTPFPLNFWCDAGLWLRRKRSVFKEVQPKDSETKHLPICHLL